MAKLGLAKLHQSLNKAGPVLLASKWLEVNEHI